MQVGRRSTFLRLKYDLEDDLYAGSRGNTTMLSPSAFSSASHCHKMSARDLLLAANDHRSHNPRGSSYSHTMLMIAQPLEVPVCSKCHP